jgi:hypothetical protein
MIKRPDDVVQSAPRVSSGFRPVAIVLGDPEEAAKAAKFLTFGHVVNVIRFTWGLFRKGPEISEAIEAWSSVMASLLPGTPGS